MLDSHQHRRPRLRDSNISDYSGYSAVPAKRLAPTLPPKLPPKPKPAQHTQPAHHHQNQHQHQHRHRRAEPDAAANTSATRHAWLCEGEAYASAAADSGASRPWYKGHMDASECERAVAGCLPGDFLVRQSASGGGCVLVANDHHTAVNYPVPLGAGGSGYTFAGSTFASLDLVIRHVRANPLRSCSGARAKLALRAAACTAPWFAGAMQRREGEALVKGAAHGDFIVRLSSTRDKFNLVVNDKGTVCTFTIKATAGQHPQHPQHPQHQAPAPAASVSFGGETHATLANLVADMQMRCFKSVVSRKMSLRRSAMP